MNTDHIRQHNRALKVVILTSPNHLYANYLVKKILARPDVCDVAGIVLSKALLPRMTYLQALGKYFRSAGFRFFAVQSLKGLIFRIACRINGLLGLGDVDSPFYYFERVTASRHIPTLPSNDINEPSTRRFVAELRPDMIVILLFGQILRAEVLRIPVCGCVNFHPSFLPEYRGLMPVFWALANGEKSTGATIHHVDEGIDTGTIIERTAIPVFVTDTEHSLYARICRQGAEMMIRVIAATRDGTLATSGQPQDGKSSYHSVPTKDAVRRFRESGRRYFSLTGLWTPFDRF